MFDDVTDDWCITCKFDKITDLVSIRTLKLFQGKELLQCEVSLLTNMMKYIDS